MDNQVYLKNVVSLAYDESKCIGCRMCVMVCPHGVFAMQNKKAALLHRDKCMECGACALNCEPGAITVNSGVGCAAAVLNSMIKGGAPACGCSTEGDCS